MKKAVVLLSGGMDSATCLAIALSEGYNVIPAVFDYGQRNRREISQALSLCSHYGLSPTIIKAPLDSIGGSALTDMNIDVPINNDKLEIPVTYVPARNTIFLSYALALAEKNDADAIFIGANARDYSGYPDCRPEYYQTFSNLANLATKRAVEGRIIEIVTPLINMTKSEIVKKGLTLSVPFKLTSSCYEGREKACGKCDSCILRLKGFHEAGTNDPLEYE